MLKVYPFGSGSYYTASYAVTASYVTTASKIEYVATASSAGTVLYPTSGSVAAVNICLLTYNQYLALLVTSSNYEQCNF